MLKSFFTFLISIFIMTAAIAQTSKQATALFKKGLEFESKGMKTEAVASFKKAITLNKKYDTAYLELGMLYAKADKTDSAIMILTNGVNEIPGFSNGFIVMGDIYRDFTKNIDEAIMSYSNALKFDTTNKVIYYSLAWCNNAKGYYREAVKYGVKALEIDNNYKIAYNELGFAYHQLKAYQECVDQFKKNLAISANDLPLLYSGYCYIELKQKENATKNYEDLNKINPKMAEALKKKIDEMP